MIVKLSPNSNNQNIGKQTNNSNQEKNKNETVDILCETKKLK